MRIERRAFLEQVRCARGGDQERVLAYWAFRVGHIKLFTDTTILEALLIGSLQDPGNGVLQRALMTFGVVGVRCDRAESRMKYIAGGWKCGSWYVRRTERVFEA
jgi:hypothetical protein